MDQLPSVAVLAGTPVDTAMGVDFLATHGYRGVPIALSKTPQEQSRLQMFDRPYLHKTCVERINLEAAQGAKAAFIYCNSLSCALDLPRLQADIPVPLITPLGAYHHIVQGYNHIALLAANGQSLHGLEGVMTELSPDIRITGASLLEIVVGIERGLPEEQLVHQMGLAEMCDGFVMLGAECIVLACTHFPYFAPSLSRHLKVPVLDPAMLMLDMLRQALSDTPAC